MLVTTRQSPDGIDVVEYGRDDFLANVWTYRPGEHVSIIGPTEAGKTVLGYQLLDVTTSARLPGLVLVMKPRDMEVASRSEDMDYVYIRSWPPPVMKWRTRKPRGWTLWPPHDLANYGKTNLNMYRQFHRAFLWAYGHQQKRGNQRAGVVVFADELAGLDDELGMSAEIKMMYSRGRTMNAGIWGATQRPVDVPKLAYSSAHHLFLAYMPDESDRKRFAEIGGGVDPKLIDAVTLRLPQYWWLYVRRKDRTLCIVRA